MKIRVIKHEVVPGCGSYEVRFPDGRPSKYFYFENLPGRRLRPDRVEQATAEQSAERFAREEWSDLCGAMCLLMNLTSVKKENTPGFPRALLPDQCGLWVTTGAMKRPIGAERACKLGYPRHPQPERG